MKKEKHNILVLAGGESTEREVSLTSACAVAQTLITGGHAVTIIDALDGRELHLTPDGLADATGKKVANPGSHRLTPLPLHGAALAACLAKAKAAGVEVALSALHGGAGENGVMQALLEVLQIPYTGSPPAASAIAMNKDISKRVMRTLEIPTADWQRFDRKADGNADDIAAEVAALAYPLPVIIKPTDGGSTVGLSLVERREDIPQAVATALAAGDSFIVEQYLQGREITIAVLDGRALAPVEIKPMHKLYDYTCKYTKGKSEYICPAVIDAGIVDRLSRDAVRLYETIGCRGYARVDFIVGTASYICLELNTLPGMTALSLFPMAARAAGMEFGELVETLCHLAMERK